MHPDAGDPLGVVSRIFSTPRFSELCNVAVLLGPWPGGISFDRPSQVNPIDGRTRGGRSEEHVVVAVASCDGAELATEEQMCPWKLSPKLGFKWFGLSRSQLAPVRREETPRTALSFIRRRRLPIIGHLVRPTIVGLPREVLAGRELARAGSEDWKGRSAIATEGRGRLPVGEAPEDGDDAVEERESRFGVFRAQVGRRWQRAVPRAFRWRSPPP